MFENMTEEEARRHILEEVGSTVTNFTVRNYGKRATEFPMHPGCMTTGK